MIREATNADAEGIARIYNFYVKNSAATFEEEEVTAAEIRRRLEKVQFSGFSWLVAFDDEELVGYAYSSKWNDRSAYRFSAEVSIYLLHERCSSGWGTRLYERLFADLKARSIHVIIGGITLPNEPSVALHEKFGMQKVSHFEQVGYKFNQWLDVGYWQTPPSP